MSKKVVLNVQFEFYPEGNEYVSKNHSDLTEAQLGEYVEKMLDTEFLALDNTANDGLWWHFEKVEVVDE